MGILLLISGVVLIYLGFKIKKAKSIANKKMTELTLNEARRYGYHKMFGYLFIWIGATLIMIFFFSL